MARILMVGCGNMGGALLARWTVSLDHDFTVIDPAQPELPFGAKGVASADDLAGQTFDALIVAVKPQLIDAAMPAAAPLLNTGGPAISIAAGASAAMTSKASGDAPVIRLMPNMPARIGRGVSGLFAQDDCTPAHKALAQELGEAVGTAIWLDEEDQIDRITAAAGSGPGYVFEFARTYQDAVEGLGFSKAEARALVLETMLGAMELAADGDTDFEALRISITSKAGTTEAGLKAMNGDGSLSEKLRATLDAAYKRGVELRG